MNTASTLFRLDGKVAVVTGGGSGIGRAVALLLARQGALVHVLDLHENDTAELINASGGKAFSHLCNVADQAQVASFFASIGSVQLLVNNAGVAHVGNVEQTLAADFDRLLQVNVKGVYHCLQAGVAAMKASGGAIVNLCSIAAHVGITDRFAYSATKGAVHAMTLSVARDYLHAGIRCNAISPARVHTPFVDGYLAKNYPGQEAEMFDKLAATQPIGRMGTVDEVAHLVLYLASDEAAFVTGNDYALDGGFLHLNN